MSVKGKFSGFIHARAVHTYRASLEFTSLCTFTHANKSR